MVSPGAEAPGRSMLRRVGTSWGQGGAQSVEYSSWLHRKSASSHSLKGHATTFKCFSISPLVRGYGKRGATVGHRLRLRSPSAPAVFQHRGTPDRLCQAAGDRSHDRSEPIAAFKGAREAPRAPQQGPTLYPMAYPSQNPNPTLRGRYGRHQKRNKQEHRTTQDAWHLRTPVAPRNDGRT